MNNTLEDLGSQEHSTHTLIIMFVIVAPLIITIIFGNSLVILAWFLDKNVRSPQNAYYVSLAFTDFLIGAFILPLVVGFVYSLNQGWIYGLPLCKTFLITMFSLNPISMYHLVTIAADRYRIITEGITYLQSRTLNGVYERCACLWILGLTISMPLIFDFDHIAIDPRGRKGCGTKKTTFWGVHVTIYLFVLPLYLIVRIYAQIYSEIKKRSTTKSGKSLVPISHQGQTQPTSDINDENSTENFSVKHTTEDINEKTSISMNRERRAIKTLAIIIGAYVVCWLPWFVFTCYSLVLPEGKNPSPLVAVAVGLFSSVNSAINPIIYAFRHPEFRKAYQKILSFQCDRKSCV